MRAYWVANREKIARQRKERYAANREELLERNRAYRKANKGSSPPRRRSGPVAETTKAKRKLWREANKEKIREQNKKVIKRWVERNRATVNARAAERRALKLGGLKAGHSPGIERALHSLAERLRGCLKSQWHVDHTIPLAKGGPHHHGNLQVVPALWNLGKNCSHEKRWGVPFGASA